MPWRVIVMVCGVTVLIALLEKAQGIDLLVSLVARISTKDTVTGVVAFLTGIISVYSSTSGVVLPAFLPMVPGLAEQLGGASPLAIAVVDEHRRPPRGRLAALDDRRAVRRRRARRGQPQACSTSCSPGACRCASSGRCSAGLF